MTDVAVKKYHPVFSGKDHAGQKVVIYQSEEGWHIRAGDGVLWTMYPGIEVETWFEVGKEVMYIQVISPNPFTPHWTGVATGTCFDLINEERI